MTDPLLPRFEKIGLIGSLHEPVLQFHSADIARRKQLIKLGFCHQILLVSGAKSAVFA
jgi:hypothetical protein